MFMGFYNLKRFFDFVCATIALLLFFPLIILVSGLVLLKIGRPIIFVQDRPGLNGKPFKMYKFRTMTDAVDVTGSVLPDEKRLTKFGALLRSTSLDELPALWNVIVGNMSLVGPRPLLMEYLPLYSIAQARRHNVRPGITGWAQVNGRNAISWEDKFKFDVWYVDNRTFWLDVKIIFLTFKKVIMRDGISADGEATMQKFTGTKKP